jgi:arylsulfatase A-like enzyme
MLLTGVNSHRTGVGAMHESAPPQLEGKPGYLTVLDRKVVTMSSRLQQHGHRTYAVGKWHVGKEDYNLPPARGFDRSIVQGDSGSDNWRTDQRYLALTDRVAWFEDGKPAQMPKEFYSSRYYVDRAIDYLRNDWSTVRQLRASRRRSRCISPFKRTTFRCRLPPRRWRGSMEGTMPVGRWYAIDVASGRSSSACCRQIPRKRSGPVSRIGTRYHRNDDATTRDA